MPCNVYAYGYVCCALCDEVTGSELDPPLCRGCRRLVARGCMRPANVGRATSDALAALRAYRRALGREETPTTAERQRWCLDYCRARGAYLRWNSGRLPPVRAVPHTGPGPPRGMRPAPPPPTRSPGTTPALGP